MSLHFFDTSALFKHYHPETGSDRVDALFAESDAIIISELAIVEFASGLCRLKNRNEIAKSSMDIALARFNADTTGDLITVYVQRDSVTTARELVLKHGIRSLDALQLQAALSIKALSPIFVSADANLLAAAQANGLATLNPLD